MAGCGRNQEKPVLAPRSSHGVSSMNNTVKHVCLPLTTYTLAGSRLRRNPSTSTNISVLTSTMLAPAGVFRW